MFDIEALKEILGSLGRRKLRLLATVFGIFWGSFMFILLIAAGKGIENGFKAKFAGRATNSFYIGGGWATISYKGFPKNRSIPLTNNDVAALRQAVPEIDLLAPRVGCWTGENEPCVERGDKSGVFNIFGDYPEYNQVDKAIVTAGRFLNQMDLDEVRKVTVIGDKVKVSMFEPGEDPIGQKIYIKNVPFDVVGVIQPVRDGGWDNRGEMVHIPITTAQRIFRYGNSIHWLAATSRDNMPASIAEQKSKRVFGNLHNVSPEDDHAFWSYNMEEEFKKNTALLDGIRILAWSVGIGTLLSGMVAVSNIMLMIVKERTKEIGIRRAVGATPFGIVSAITTESLILTLSAGSSGLVVGVWTVYLANWYMTKYNIASKIFKSPDVGFDIALASVAVYAVVGVGAALLPAFRALAIKPTEALRDKI